jgi:hypothetical protein
VAIHRLLQPGDGEIRSAARVGDDARFRGDKFIGHADQLAEIDFLRNRHNAMLVGMNYVARCNN